ncbi:MULTISPECIES: VOC family protein [Inquilinus]|uniref:PhnB protein n=1 Tax=Inquilinus ginsengisoli TaxID=363840 RepID=A0ABU1JN97_9PROT|nr:VOC family protein [Inquilinus ginsengisoli]MDR6290086.1 PhnB protein [Inquilinus ginsengisoli]
MAAKVKPVPEGYPTLTPYLIIRNAAAAIEFYQVAFGAAERMRMDAPGGAIGHAELLIGGSLLMLADEMPEMGYSGPEAVGGTPVSLMLYVGDVDAVVERAVAAGATLSRPVADQFYGDRSGTVIDPFGHVWTIATHVEDVPPDEMRRRAAALAGPA